MGDAGGLFRPADWASREALGGSPRRMIVIPFRRGVLPRSYSSSAAVIVMRNSVPKIPVPIGDLILGVRRRSVRTIPLKNEAWPTSRNMEDWALGAGI